MMSRQMLGLCRRVYTCTVRAPQPRSSSALHPLSSTAPQSLSSTALLHTSAITQQANKAKEVIKEEGEGKADVKGPAPLAGIWQDFADLNVAIPSKDTPDMMVDGVKYSELPICHVTCAMNNTIISITDHTGTVPKIHASCGMEGFRNAKKKTAVAAQATALALSQRAVKRGVQNVRVVLKGFNVGREAAVKGLTMGGLKIVSITDDTHWRYTLWRPRKQIKK